MPALKARWSADFRASALAQLISRISARLQLLNWIPIVMRLSPSTHQKMVTPGRSFAFTYKWQSSRPCGLPWLSRRCSNNSRPNWLSLHAKLRIGGSRHCSRCSIRHFSVLALESSADDTGAAIVTSDGQILSNVVRKQIHLHEGLGGIYPPIAIQAHQASMPGAVQQALSDASMKITDVDGIAFTRGPGIGGCLSVAANAAKTLAAALEKPLVGVHHMQAHALTPFLTTPASDAPQYPFLTVLVSGGHTLLLLATSVSSFRTLATTADESIGRAYDKVSRLLGLPWGDKGLGASLDEFCAPHMSDLGAPWSAGSDTISLPRPARGAMMFSYSGLHSAVERRVSAVGGAEGLPAGAKLALACEFQRAAVGQLEEKLSLGLSWCQNNGFTIRHIVVSGGVASNSYMRKRLVEFARERPDPPLTFVFPPQSLCTDNAAMIAWASMYRFLTGDHDAYDVEIRPRWDISELRSHGS